MKKLLFILTILTVLTGCRKSTDDAHISGAISGLGNDTIYLFNEFGNENLIDTIFVNKDKFAYDIPVDTLSIYMLLFKDGTEYPLFLNRRDRLEITGNANALDALEVEGSAPNEALTHFEKTVLLNDSLNTAEKLRSVEAYIRQNSTSIVSVYLLDRYFAQQPSPDYRKIKDLISSLSGIMQDQPVIEFINERIDMLDKTGGSRSAPFFNVPDAEGTKITRASKFADKYLILTFWASWSDSCKENNRQLRALQKQFKKDESLGILGISLDVDRDAWLNAIESDTLDWVNASDLAGFNSNLVTSFGISSLPTNYLISPTGIVLLKGVTPDSIAKRLPIYLTPANEARKKRNARK